MSLPVQFGIEKAKWICAASIDLTQIAVAGYLALIGETTYAAVLTALILPQIYLQTTTILVDPIENDVKYQAAAQPFLVLGILTTALACGHHTW
jgi:chlorophyll synthase